jgi:uridine kinase
MNEGTRADLLDRLAGAIESVTTSHPLRVAVDGPPAAGKTTLADRRWVQVKSAPGEPGRGGCSG